MSWTAGGNVKKLSDIDTLTVTSDLTEKAYAAQHEAAVKAAKAQAAALGKAEEYIVHMSGQLAPDKPGQPHSPQAAIAVHVATTIPIG